MTITGRSPRALNDTRAVPLQVSAGWLFSRIGKVMVWFVSILLLAFLITYGLTETLGGVLPFSILEGAADNAPAWFLFAMGVSLVSGYLPVLMAQGVTRASFAAASVLAILTAALILAAIFPVAYWLESLAYGRNAWAHDLRSAHFFADIGQVGLVFIEGSLRYLLFGVLGVMVGLIYYRAGGIWGTALLPVSLGPPLLLAYALFDPATNTVGFLGWHPAQLTVAARAGLALLLTAGAAVAVRLLIGRVAIRPKGA